MQIPCRLCKDSYIGCHSDQCDKWMHWIRWKEAKKKRIAEEKSIEDYFYENAWMHRARSK